MKVFEHHKIDALQFDLYSKISGNGRFYITKEGKKYPSVTTILSSLNKEHLEEWKKRVGEDEANKISKAAAFRGTALHDTCERYLRNNMGTDDMMSLMPNVKQLFLSVKPELENNIDKICCLEQALYSHRLKVAGRVDCIAEWDGVLSIIDFKNSLKPKKESYITNYFWQCTAYACMFAELTGTPIKQIVVAIGVVDNPKPQIFVRNVSDYIEDTIRFIKKYHLTN